MILWRVNYCWDNSLLFDEATIARLESAGDMKLLYFRTIILFLFDFD